jgi:hypothetical protein
MFQKTEQGFSTALITCRYPTAVSRTDENFYRLSRQHTSAGRKCKQTDARVQIESTSDANRSVLNFSGPS